MLIVFAGILLLFTSVSSNNHSKWPLEPKTNHYLIVYQTVFIEHPRSLLLPIGERAQVTCRTQEQYRIQWIILLQNPKATIVTDIGGTEMVLSKYGITVQGLSTRTSMLSIQSQQIEDEIRLTCQALRQSNRISSNVAEVIFFGELWSSLSTQSLWIFVGNKHNLLDGQQLEIYPLPRQENLETNRDIMYGVLDSDALKCCCHLRSTITCQ